MMDTSHSIDSPVSIFMKLHDCVLHFDADGQADLFDENGIWELPFATDPIPKKIIGREAIRQFGKIGMACSQEKGRKLLRYAHLKVYETSEQDTIVVTFDLEGEITQSGQTYSIPFIQIIQVAKGRIVVLKDYFNADMLK